MHQAAATVVTTHVKFEESLHGVDREMLHAFTLYIKCSAPRYMKALALDLY